MQIDTANAAIDFVLSEARKSNVQYLDITFFGGEPLIESELLFLIADRFRNEKSLDQLLSFRLSTNGTLLTEHLMEQMMQREIYVSLSVDGPPDIHDLQRVNVAGKGSSQAVEKAIQVLLKANPCANVTCVLTPTSASRAYDCIDWLFNKGFRYFNLTLDYGADWTMSDMKKLESSYRELGIWYEQKISKNHRFYLSCFDERIRSRTMGKISNSEKCDLGFRQFSIAPDGGLYPCTQFVTTAGLPEFLIGHVKQGGFNHDCRKYVHNCSESPKPECKGCALTDRCASWCSCINFASTGSVTSASPVICHHERVLIPIVDEMANRLWRKRNRMFLHKHYNPSYPLIDFLEHIV